jgi:protein TonB
MTTRFLGCLLAVNLAFAGSALAQGSNGASLAVVSPATAASVGGSGRAAAPAAVVAFKPDSIFINPDVRPQFIGGAEALHTYMAKNMHYPEQAMKQKVAGKVYVRFVLSAAGRITDASVVRGPGSGLNEEALRLVWLMPPWQPGWQRGQAVRVVCTMPIEFQL